MIEISGSGRPRSHGTLYCDRCENMVAKIRVQWPDGAICGACFSSAVNTSGICAHCHESRLLPGRSSTGEEICRDCAGITTNLTCSRCGAEAERRRHGHCARCIVVEDLTVILKPNDLPDLRLHQLIRELSSTDRPRSVITWMRAPQVQSLLKALGARTLELSHEAFDKLPTAPSTEHLREMLVHHRILPSRGDIRLVRFEHWLDARLENFQDQPYIQKPLEQFGRWYHLRRLRELPEQSNMDYATRSAKQEITEAGKFLLWLETELDKHLDQISQEDIDLYWSEGTSTRKHIRNFLIQRKIAGPDGPFNAKARQAMSSPMASTTSRLEAIHTVVEAEDVYLGTRVAALIFLLYGVPIGKLSSLQADAIQSDFGGMTIRLGIQPAPVPEPLIPLFASYLQHGANSRSMNKGSVWLFPSTLAGQHISANNLWNRLKVFGLQPQAMRNTTLFELAKELDPSSLAALLGYTSITMTHYSSDAGNNMGSYPAVRKTAQNDLSES